MGVVHQDKVRQKHSPSGERRAEFRSEPDIPNEELLELARGEETMFDVAGSRMQ
jgi:hypothetical protein